MLRRLRRAILPCAAPCEESDGGARVWGRVAHTLRTERGLTQEALAAEAELDRTYPSLLEHGKREPSLDVFLRLSAALDVTPTALLAAVLARLPAGYARQWLILPLASPDPPAPPPRDPHLAQAA